MTDSLDIFPLAAAMSALINVRSGELYSLLSATDMTTLPPL